MDAERLRAFLLALPHVAETVQWGNNLVFWVGDKAIGGKMFALINLDDPVEGRTPSVIAYAAGPHRFPELCELEGLYPAPYLARAHWIAAEHWLVHSPAVWQSELRAAHALTLSKLPPRTRSVLTMPRAAQRRILHDRKQLRAAKAKLPATSNTTPPAAPKKSVPKKKSAPAGSAKRPPAKHQTNPGTKAGKPRSKRSPAA